ncbi:sensor histidine kinase [Allobacillus sp. GCM10007491]|uniref:histidine kinase n=1 Tax=Allobacillus saliphilus TaxID=2912308 RepID=A0A941CTQ1_9BACI|nr:sensor histidine kinase [Allobacillus saliphilus]MBR7553768.1 sensor histidine kinase [Allobacillus saliphilus]
MILKYINERKSWISVFVLFELLLLFMAYLDRNWPVSSVTYFVFLTSVIFVIFLIIRYLRESKFYKSMDNQSSELDTSEIPKPFTPFEKVVAHRLNQQFDKLRSMETENRIQLEEEKDELLSWIHEIKAPLSAMNLIIDRIENPTLKSDLDYEWLRIHMLLDQQLHQKRIAVIESDLYMEKVFFEPLIHEEIRTMKSWCIYKSIGFDIDLQEETVLTDVKWLSFILRQLLSNAVKYSEESDIYIQSERQNGQAYLSIRDEGQGIHAKDLPRIFEKGFTSTFQKNHGATGMGLFLAKQAAESLHIKLEVESKPTFGTTITLIFPKKNEVVDLWDSR